VLFRERLRVLKKERKKIRKKEGEEGREGGRRPPPPAAWRRRRRRRGCRPRARVSPKGRGGRWSWVVLVVWVVVLVVVEDDGGGCCGGCGDVWKWWGVRGGGGDVVGLVGMKNLVEMRVNFGKEKEEG